jgi:flagellin-specific chaperone FliS
MQPIAKIDKEIELILQYEPDDDEEERLLKIYDFLLNDLVVEEKNRHY